MSNTPLTREMLHQQVWSEPIVHVAKRLGISGRGLGKLCARHNIPVPPRGWWARKRHGHNVRQTPLPPLAEGASAIIVINKEEEPQQPVQPTDLPPEIAFELAPENRILVPERIARLHPFVVKTRDVLKEANPSSFTHNRLVPPAVTTGTLDIKVSRSLVPRALRIMDTLIRALDVRGYAPTLSPKKAGLSVNVLGEPFRIALDEKTRQVKRPPKDWEERGIAEGWRKAEPYDLMPSGALRLRIYDEHWVQYELHDGAKKPLEGGLNGFIVKLVEKAFEARRLREKRERERVAQAKADAARREREARRAEEEEMEKQWDEWMAAWKKTHDIRAFASAVRDACEPIEADGKVEGWLRFADAYAGRMDPLKR